MAVRFIVALAWLAFSTPAAALTVLDLTGREVTLTTPPRRIVSLVPSATEILFAVGSDDRLVGVTDYCDYPPEAQRKSRVGGMVNPSLETIVALRPDLVIATPEGNREETFQALRRAGIPVYLVAARRLADVMTAIERLGALTGRREAARAVMIGLEQRIDAVRRAVAARPRPRVLYIVWPEPLVVPGRDALVTELIALAGGQSITADAPAAYPRLGLEAAVARRPEVIFLATHGAGAAAAPPETWTRLRAVPAIRNGTVHAADGNLLHRYTPRVVDGLEAIARALHPGLAPGPGPAGTGVEAAP